MRRGCIAFEEIRCDGCHQMIPHAARYLAIAEEDSVAAEKGTTAHYCVDCALEKGYASQREEKGEKILTFFA